MPTIREARPTDLTGVLELLKSADLPTEDVPSVFGESFALATDGSAIVGVAGVECHENLGLFRSVCVRPDQQGKGVAAALVRDRIQWAKNSGIEELYLLTLSAADYFGRYGFETITRADVPKKMLETYEFSALCPDGATVMRLKL